MLRSLAAPLPFRSEGAIGLIHALLNAIGEARAGRARAEIARRAGLIASARKHRLVLDGRLSERRHG
jgi:hypothetical protein